MGFLDADTLGTSFTDTPLAQAQVTQSKWKILNRGGRGERRVFGWLCGLGKHCCKSELFPQSLALPMGSSKNAPFVKPARVKLTEKA